MKRQKTNIFRNPEYNNNCKSIFQLKNSFFLKDKLNTVTLRYFNELPMFEIFYQGCKYILELLDVIIRVNKVISGTSGTNLNMTSTPLKKV